MKKIFSYDWISTVIFNITILLFIIGFGFTDTPTPFGWYQQFMPNIGSRQISDVTFTDSLTGYASAYTTTDTNYVLKTTTGGDSWNIIYGDYHIFNRVQFLNQFTGYVCGAVLTKTTNGGINWFNVNTSGIVAQNIYALNEDTIWIIYSDALTGGVFFTSNGGTNWVPQAAFGNSNPSHIYMYNARLGFVDAGGLRRTTDGGTTWTPVAGAGNFLDMHFVDSLTGWKCNQDMKKTTDGGFNWITQTLPAGGNIVLNYMVKFSNINIDSLWGVGGVTTINGGSGMIFRTTNSGNTWVFQIADTSIHIAQYIHNKFTNRLNGWAYSGGPGVHTVTGGNDTNFTGLKQISYNIPGNFILFQNYPNPFNPITKLKYDLTEDRGSKLEVRLVIYNILGKEIKTLVNQMQSAGEYEVTFDGSNLSSGVYFYSLIVNGNLIDTRKMILLK